MTNKDFSDPKAMYTNCTLKKSHETSHTDNLIEVSRNIMEKEKISVEQIRFIDLDVAHGIHPDMTEYGWKTDEWPHIFKRIMTRIY